MDEAEFRRFVNMLLWLVIDENESLGQFGSASTEFADGQSVVWGPWPRADCSELLLRWFDAGLLSVFGLGIDNELPTVEARRLLADHESWTSGGPEPFVGATQTGITTPDEAWFEVVREIGGG